MSYRCFQITKDLVVLEFAPQTRTVIINQSKYDRQCETYCLSFPYTVFLMPICGYQIGEYSFGFCKSPLISKKDLLYAPPLPNIWSGEAQRYQHFLNLQVCLGETKIVKGKDLKEIILRTAGAFWQSTFNFYGWADNNKYRAFLKDWQINGNWESKIDFSIAACWHPNYAETFSEVMSRSFSINTFELKETSI